MDFIVVAGMRVPVSLVPEIVDAVRDTYPTVTEGLEGEAAVRAVMKYLFVQILADYRARKEVEPLEDDLHQLREHYAVRAEAARDRVILAAQAITDAAVP